MIVNYYNLDLHFNSQNALFYKFYSISCKYMYIDDNYIITRTIVDWQQSRGEVVERSGGHTVNSALLMKYFNIESGNHKPN